MQRLIYLDHHSTTPLDPRVFKAMEPYWMEDFGNAASRTHAFGWKAQAAVENARSQVAASLGAIPEEIVFTSGATESNNLAILGLAKSLSGEPWHLMTVATEHHAVLDPCRYLETQGVQVTYLSVDSNGQVHPQQVVEALRPETRLISVMSANNEIGTLQPIAEIARIAAECNILLHCDAAQSIGKIAFDTSTLGVDLISFSGHKIYGPKGIGGLFIRKKQPKIRLQPLFYGGGHEKGLRSGTLPVPLIVGLGEALSIAVAEMDDESRRLAEWRDRLHQKIIAALPGVKLNGHPTQRLPHNLNLSFSGVDGAALLRAMDEVAVSSGSACTSANPEPSYVLQAIGLSKEMASASLRFGLGRFNRLEEIDFAAEKTIAAVLQLRSQNT